MLFMIIYYFAPTKIHILQMYPHSFHMKGEIVL